MIRNDLLKETLDRTAPVGTYEGLRAITAQSYTEVNVKTGSQFEASLFRTALAGAGTVAVAIETGSKPVIMKAIQISLDGSGVTLQIFKDPAYSAGNSVDIFNLTEINPMATTVTMTDDVTVSDPGTEIAAPIYYIGSTQPGIGSGGTSGVVGLERLLEASSVYLIRATSRDVSAMDISNYMTWYEGEPDLPL